MFGDLAPGGEMIVGLPHAYSFVPTGTPAAAGTLWMGSLSAGAGALSGTALPVNQLDSTPMYTCVLAAANIGNWTLIVRDGSNNILHTAIFRAVLAEQAQHSLGLQNKQNTTVISWSPYLLNTQSQASWFNLTNGGATTKFWFEKLQHVAPIDGYLWGVSFATTSGTAWATIAAAGGTVRFFSLNPADGSCRGMSDNMVAKLAAAQTIGSYRSVLFGTAVPIRAGDYIGCEINAGTATAADHLVFTTGVTGFTRLWNVVGAVNVAGGNNVAAANDGGANVLQIQYIIRPPSIVFGGHSLWSGSTDSSSTYENGDFIYARAQDLAAMVGDRLGVPCLNAAWGGTAITNWLGPALNNNTITSPPQVIPASGMFETFVTPLKPSLFIYDSVYNDCNVFGGQGGFTFATYRQYLDRLLVHCNQQGIELGMLLAPGSIYGTTHTTVAGSPFFPLMNQFNAIVADWCQTNGVLCVPLYFTLGQFGNVAGEPANGRWYQKYFNTQNPSWGLPDYAATDTVHLSQAGRIAAAMTIAQAIRNRGYRDQLLLRDYSATTGDLGLTSASGMAQSALTAQGVTTGRAANLDNLNATVSSRMATSALPANFSTLSIDSNGLMFLSPTGQPIVQGSVALAGSTASFNGSAGLSVNDNFYHGQSVAFTSGNMQGQSRVCTAYTGATRTFTFANAFPSPGPALNDTFDIVGGNG